MRNRARAIAALLALTVAASAAFIAAYALRVSEHLQGVVFAFAASMLAVALVAGSGCLQREEIEDEREPLDDESVALPRANMLVRFGVFAAAIFGVAAIAPWLSLAPEAKNALMHTKWRRGSRLRRENGAFVHRSDLNVDEMVTVFPEDAPDDALSQAVLLRLPSSVANAVDGYVAFSKLCTHAGCPVALYRARSKQLLCPCHQSLFDVMDGGRVVSGPADHALPELSLAFDDRGYLRANGDFPVPVGPAFWGRP